MTKSGNIAVGLSKGHVVTERKVEKISRRKGVRSRHAR